MAKLKVKKVNKGFQFSLSGKINVPFEPERATKATCRIIKVHTYLGVFITLVHFNRLGIAR